MDTDYIENNLLFISVPRKTLFRNSLTRLADKLEPLDVVSLLYLMSDDDSTDKIYDKLFENLSNITAKTVDFSTVCEKYVRNWRNKILEALVVMEMYEALLNVFSVNKLDAIYNTRMNDSWLSCNRVRLFKICEGLDTLRKEIFLQKMEEVLTRENCRVKMPPVGAPLPYLEMYFMFWHLNGIITSSGKNFHLVLECLEATGVDELIGLFTTTSGTKPTEERGLSVYPILDENDVGLCVIINQYEFDDPANNRKSSCVDEAALRTVMESLHFDVQVLSNLRGHEMASLLKETINIKFRRHHSILFVAIMSHGVNGSVMGVDGVYVGLDSLSTALFTAKHISGIPKIVVVNACRGENCFTTARALYETDGPITVTKKVRSDLMDVITCFSTLPDFITVRNKEKGSLFMQTLCEVLEQRSDSDVFEIFTIVNNALMNPRDYRCYNPFKLAHPCEFNSRLLKKLYLKKISSGTNQRY